MAVCLCLELRRRIKKIRESARLVTTRLLPRQAFILRYQISSLKSQLGVLTADLSMPVKDISTLYSTGNIE